MTKRFEFDSKKHTTKGYFNIIGIVGRMENEVKEHRQSQYNDKIKENTYTIEIMTSDVDKIDVKLKYRISDEVNLIGIHIDDMENSVYSQTPYNIKYNRLKYEKEFVQMYLGKVDLIGVKNLSIFSKEVMMIMNSKDDKGNIVRNEIGVTGDIARQVLLGTGTGNQSNIKDGQLKEGQLVRVQGYVTPYKFVSDSNKVIDGYSYNLNKIEIIDDGEDNTAEQLASVRERDIKRAKLIKEKAIKDKLDIYSMRERIMNNYKHSLADFTLDIVYSTIKYEDGKYYLYGVYVNFAQKITPVRLEVVNTNNPYAINKYMVEGIDDEVKHLLENKSKYERRKISVSGILVNSNKENKDELLKSFTPIDNSSKTNIFMKTLNISKQREEIVEEVSAEKNINRRTTNHLVVTAIWSERSERVLNKMDVYPKKYTYVKEQKYSALLMEQKKRLDEIKKRKESKRVPTLNERLGRERKQPVKTVQEEVAETVNDKKISVGENDTKLLNNEFIELFNNNKHIELKTREPKDNNVEGSQKVVPQKVINSLINL